MLSYGNPPSGPRLIRCPGALRGVAIATLAMALLACDGRPRYHFDAAVDPDSAQPWPDATVQPDSGSEIFAGLTVTGCAEQEVTAEAATCLGTVPLTLSFSSLAPPNASTFKWEFGDETPEGTTPSIEHVYAGVGTFTVVLTVGGPFGSIQPSQLTEIVVLAAEPGDFCSEDDQCHDGRCLCGDPTEPGCPSILAGTCVANCPSCPGDTLCVDLSVQDQTHPASWRSQSCLPGCDTDDDCVRGGFGCRELPVVEAPQGREWMPICFPDVLADVGESCHDATDIPAPSICLSGSCAALGRYGLCTDGCLDSPCPSYATCVSFSGGVHAGEPLCLSRCTQDRPCTHDPQLACETPDGAGDLGFVLLDANEPAGHSYCAPRRCAEDLDCPTVSCDLPAGGFCL